MDGLLSERTASGLFWLVAAGLAAVGTGATALAVRCGLRATASASGTVVGLEATTDSDGATLYRAVVVFTADGAEHRTADPLARSPAAYRVGQRVRVCYPPGRPESAQLGRWRFVGPFLGLAAVGWGLLAVGLVWRLA